MSVLRDIYIVARAQVCRVLPHPGPDPRWKELTGQDRCRRCFKVLA